MVHSVILVSVTATLTNGTGDSSAVKGELHKTISEHTSPVCTTYANISIDVPIEYIVIVNKSRNSKVINKLNKNNFTPLGSVLGVHT